MIDQIVQVMLGENCTARVQDFLRDSYEQRVPELWRTIGLFLGRESDPPSIRVVYTFTARPQSLRLGAERFLIYDQYLGQVMNQLTRLAVNQAPVLAVDAYLVKLVAQRFLVAGNAQGAVRNGLHAYALRERLSDSGYKLRDSGRSLEERSALTACQEYFIIAHELAHSYLAANPDIFEELRHDYLDMIVPSFQSSFGAQEKASSFDESNKLAYYSDVRREYERRWGVTITDDEHEAAVRDAPPLERGASFADIADELATDVSQVEECICDLIGAFAAAGALARRRIPLSVVLPGASLALHHLRLLQVIDRMVGGSWGSDLGSLGADPFASSMLRLSLFRFGALFTAHHLLGAERPKLARFLHSRLVKANLMHAEFVLDPFLFGIGELIKDSSNIPITQEEAEEQLTWAAENLL